MGVRGPCKSRVCEYFHIYVSYFVFCVILSVFFYQIVVSHGVFQKNRSFYESVGVRGGPWRSVGVRGPCKSRVCEYFHIYVSYLVFSVILGVFFYQIVFSNGVFHKNRSFYESVGVRWCPWRSVGARGPCKSRVCEFLSGIFVAIIQMCQYVKTDSWPKQSKTPRKSLILRR